MVKSGWKSGKNELNVALISEKFQKFGKGAEMGKYLSKMGWIQIQK